MTFGAFRGLIQIVSFIPFKLGMRVGAVIGALTFVLASNRRGVARANIRICFKNKTRFQRAKVVGASFIELGRGFIETAWAWYAPQEFFTKRTTILGAELIQQAQADGRGILLMGPHYSFLDAIAPCIHSVTGPITITYRPPRNRQLNELIIERRSRYGESLNVRSTRKIVSKLKQQAVLWYSPDQDMGQLGSVFAPFFGQLASTTTSVARLCRLTDAKPIFVSMHRDSESYVVRFCEFPSTYPEPDEEANARTLNAIIENTVIDHPGQYMWIHKRFKTNPDGSRQTFYQ